MPSKEKLEEAVQQAFEQKLNYNCPDAEKSGSGPGACTGGAKGKEEAKPSSLNKQAMEHGKKLLNDLGDKYKAADKAIKDFSKTKANLDAPRNAAKIKELTAKRDRIGQTMDRIQKSVDKFSGNVKAEGKAEKSNLAPGVTKGPVDNFKPVSKGELDAAKAKFETPEMKKLADKIEGKSDLSKMKESDISHNIYSPSSTWSDDQKREGMKYLDQKQEGRRAEGISSDLKPGVATAKEFGNTFENDTHFHQEIKGDLKQHLSEYLGKIGQYNEFNPDKVADTIGKHFSEDKIKLGREDSPVVYIDKQIGENGDTKDLEKSVNRIGRSMKADGSSVKVVGNVARIRFWWD